jgi:hypothetical protein
MNEPNETLPQRRYLWPWFVLAAFVLAVVLAVVWMSFAVKREREQRDYSAPIQTM